MNSPLTTENLITITETHNVDGKLFYDQEQYNFTEIVEGEFTCCEKKSYYKVVIDGVSYNIDSNSAVLASEITGRQGQYHYHREIDRFDQSDVPLELTWRPDPAEILRKANNIPM